MNKAELIAAAHVKAQVSRRDAEEVLEAVLDLITDCLLKGEDVKLSGFGNFEVKTRAARVGTNPSTGAKINIPESKTITFKPSKGIKGELND